MWTLAAQRRTGHGARLMNRPLVVLAALLAPLLLLACQSSSGGSAGGAADAGPEASTRVAVQLLAFNDFHGNLAPPTGSTGSVLAPASDPAAALGTAVPGDTSR